MAVAGLRGTGDFGTDERPKNFRETILWLNPNGMAPIFALTSKAKKRTTDDPQFFWWNEPNGHIRVQVSGALGTTDTLITVSSVDPTGTTMDAQWGAADNLQVGDVLQIEIPSASDSAAYVQELVEVTGVISPTQFTVARGVAGSTPASIANGAFMTVIGSAFAEGTGAPRAVSRNPIKFTNFTQIFKNTFELSGTADQTRYRTGEPWSNDKKRKTFDHARNIEMAMLYGKAFETTGPNGKPKRYMAGIRTFIPASRQTIFVNAPGTPITTSNLLDAIYPVFNYDTAAGDERIVFAGNVALNSFNKMVRADPSNHIHFDGVTSVYGMKFNTFVIPQGRLLIKTHPLLNIHPEFSKSMIVLDFDAIKYVAMKGRDTKAFNDVQLKDEDVRRGFYQTECSLEIDYGGLTMAYIGNFIVT